MTLSPRTDAGGADTAAKGRLWRGEEEKGAKYLKTTTMGLSLPVATISPFQIISAEKMIIEKFNTWNKICGLGDNGSAMLGQVARKSVHHTRGRRSPIGCLRDTGRELSGGTCAGSCNHRQP